MEDLGGLVGKGKALEREVKGIARDLKGIGEEGKGIKNGK